MAIFKTIIAGTTGLLITGAGVWNTIDTLVQPGQPSKQPEPKNRLPKPQNPIPDPSRQNPISDPNSPGAPNPPPTEQERNRDNPRDNDKERNANRNRNPRLFAFQSPDMEGRFKTATRPLVQMEQRMQRSQEDLLKRLGEARTLSGERQTTALFDVIQQMMKEQVELHRYLAKSRAAWTGDLDDDDAAEEGAAPSNGR